MSSEKDIKDKQDSRFKQDKPTPPSSSSSKGLKRKSEEDQGSEYLRRKHNFIKSTIRTDYQPDICKDYKETGFCGFGDSCKFLHDRTDYKHGWQLDQEWAKGQYKEEDDDAYLIKESEEEGEGEIPTNCTICKEPYKDPIETKCKHYFCINCAEKECSEKCFTCEQQTSGIFKNAKKKIEEKKSKGSPPKNEPVVEENSKSDSDENDSSIDGIGTSDRAKDGDESSNLSDYYD